MATTAAIPCEQEANTLFKDEYMTYLGERMYSCHTLYPWALAHIVVVSGSGPNVCGHTLLNVGQFYFHIDGLYQYPWHFNNAGYRRYLNENEKTEIFRRHVKVPEPDKAQRKLEELSVAKWPWGGTVNNCVTFVEDILATGGSKDSSLTNCPVLWK